MKCPTCKKEVQLGDEFMPFCSERCKLLDLGAWASEKFVISTPIEPELPPSGEREKNGED